MKHEKHSPANSVSPFRMEAPSTRPERRKNLRKPLHFPVYFQKVGAQDGRLLSGNTVNVSPGGALVRIQGAMLRDGELVSVEMAPPASEGLLEQRGRFHGYARVVRVDAPAVDANNGKQVALEFCESARLDF
jgi:hypothetical protein